MIEQKDMKIFNNLCFNIADNLLFIPFSRVAYEYYTIIQMQHFTE